MDYLEFVRANELYHSDEELYHHGIIGMKWGRRRWQNPDGSLTPEGVAHYKKAKAEARAKTMAKNKKAKAKAAKKALRDEKRAEDKAKRAEEREERDIIKNVEKVKDTIGSPKLKNYSDEELNKMLERLKLEDQVLTAMNKVTPKPVTSDSFAKKAASAMGKNILEKAIPNVATGVGNLMLDMLKKQIKGSPEDKEKSFRNAAKNMSEEDLRKATARANLENNYVNAMYTNRKKKEEEKK